MTEACIFYETRGITLDWNVLPHFAFAVQGWVGGAQFVFSRAYVLSHVWFMCVTRVMTSSSSSNSGMQASKRI